MNIELACDECRGSMRDNDEMFCEECVDKKVDEAFEDGKETGRKLGYDEGYQKAKEEFEDKQ